MVCFGVSYAKALPLGCPFDSSSGPLAAGQNEKYGSIDGFCFRAPDLSEVFKSLGR